MEDSESGEFVYVLLLENNKYYVGRTNDVERRFREHKKSTNEWLRQNKPIRVIEKRPLMGLFDEDNKTKSYMYVHGINNVRGGAYTTYTLSDDVVSFLQKELVHSFNLCFKCGQAGHYANSCTG